MPCDFIYCKGKKHIEFALEFGRPADVKVPSYNVYRENSRSKLSCTHRQQLRDWDAQSKPFFPQGKTIGRQSRCRLQVANLCCSCYINFRLAPTPLRSYELELRTKTICKGLFGLNTRKTTELVGQVTCHVCPVWYLPSSNHGQNGPNMVGVTGFLASAKRTCDQFPMMSHQFQPFSPTHRACGRCHTGFRASVRQCWPQRFARKWPGQAKALDIWRMETKLEASERRVVACVVGVARRALVCCWEGWGPQKTGKWCCWKFGRFCFWCNHPKCKRHPTHTWALPLHVQGPKAQEGLCFFGGRCPGTLHE